MIAACSPARSSCSRRTMASRRVSFTTPPQGGILWTGADPAGIAGPAVRGRTWTRGFYYNARGNPGEGSRVPGGVGGVRPTRILAGGPPVEELKAVTPAPADAGTAGAVV